LCTVVSQVPLWLVYLRACGTLPHQGLCTPPSGTSEGFPTLRPNRGHTSFTNSATWRASSTARPSQSKGCPPLMSHTTFATACVLECTWTRSGTQHTTKPSFGPLPTPHAFTPPRGIVTHPRVAARVHRCRTPSSPPSPWAEFSGSRGADVVLSLTLPRHHPQRLHSPR
jgi:hypothetical protein